MTETTRSPANLSDVNELRTQGVVSAADYLDAVQSVRDKDWWHTWAVRLLATLGGVHLLAGVVFFFAYNWDDLTPFTKFAVLQGAILIAFVGAVIARIDRAVGEGLLIAASVFTGVLFAVIGQVYQTGADAWELFAAWSLLILPWALVSRSSAHWMLWIVILLCAAGFFGEQVLVSLGTIDRDHLGTAIAVLALLLLLLREFLVVRGADWLDDRWFQIALTIFGLGTLFVPGLWFVFSIDQGGLSFAAFVIASIALGAFFYRTRPAYPVLALIAVLVTLMGMAIGARLIHEAVGFDNDAAGLIASLVLLVAWCVALTGGLVRLLSALHRDMHPGEQHG